MVNFNFSVVISVWNGNTGNYNIERTLKSLISQTYKNIEIIVVDGGSTDGTIDILKKYSSKSMLHGKILKYVSEKDKGIYDAMNKGVKMSSGDVLSFLNSDDFILDKEVFDKINIVFNKNSSADILHGDIFVVHKKLNDSDEYLGVSSKSPDYSESNLKKGIQVFHPATFIKKSFFQKVGYFSLNYKSASDLDFFCKSLKYSPNTKELPFLVTAFFEGGVSSSRFAHLESIRVIRNNFGVVCAIPLYVRFLVAFFFRAFIKLFNLEKKWIERKNKLNGSNKVIVNF